MKRNRIFQSKQQLRGFSEGDFIDRGILLCSGRSDDEHKSHNFGLNSL